MPRLSPKFAKYNSDLNGAGALDKIYEGYTFEEALDRCLKMKNEKYARSVNRCPGKTFLLIRKNDNKIIGCANLRWNLTKKVLKFGGHIGYSIRPTERRKGYNKINLYLGLKVLKEKRKKKKKKKKKKKLKEAKKIGLDKVMLDCSVNNYGSDKTIKALGGVLERCEIDPWVNELTNVYWIDINNSLEKYQDKYEKYISKEK